MVKSLSRGEPAAAAGCWHQIPASTEPQAPGMRPGSLGRDPSAWPAPRLLLAGKSRNPDLSHPFHPKALPRCLPMIPGPDGSGRQGQVPLENLLFQQGGILAGGCGRSSPGGLECRESFPSRSSLRGPWDGCRARRVPIQAASRGIFQWNVPPPAVRVSLPAALERSREFCSIQRQQELP